MLKELNPLLHSQLRLAVMSILMNVDEADFVYISKSGYLHEIEVKISIADFRNDQKKRHFHDHPEVRGFSYCMPSELYQAHPDEIKSVCEEKGAGLILVQDNGTIKTVIEAIPRLHVPKLPLQSLIFYLDKLHLCVES